MKQPLHVTLRAFGQGATAGTLIAVAACLVTTYLSPETLLALALLAGPGLLYLSHLLERRARRSARKE